MFRLFKKSPDTAMQTMQEEPAAMDKLREEALRADTQRIKALAERNAAHIALREIVAAETPQCANIGKKMARIAREALPEYAAGEREAA